MKSPSAENQARSAREALAETQELRRRQAAQIIMEQEHQKELKELSEHVEKVFAESSLQTSAVDAKDAGSPIENPPKQDHHESMTERVAKLEGAHEGLKRSQNILIMSVMGLAALFFALAGIMVSLQISTNSHIDQVQAKVDSISDRLSAEFAAQRAEMSAQTSAISNAITATKQQAPQVILVPSPAPTNHP